MLFSIKIEIFFDFFIKKLQQIKQALKKKSLFVTNKLFFKINLRKNPNLFLFL